MADHGRGERVRSNDRSLYASWSKSDRRANRNHPARKLLLGFQKGIDSHWHWSIHWLPLRVNVGRYSGLEASAKLR